MAAAMAPCSRHRRPTFAGGPNALRTNPARRVGRSAPLHRRGQRSALRSGRARPSTPASAPAPQIESGRSNCGRGHPRVRWRRAAGHPRHRRDPGAAPPRRFASRALRRRGYRAARRRARLAIAARRGAAPAHSAAARRRSRRRGGAGVAWQRRRVRRARLYLPAEPRAQRSAVQGSLGPRQDRRARRLGSHHRRARSHRRGGRRRRRARSS